MWLARRGWWLGGRMFEEASSDRHVLHALEPRAFTRLLAKYSVLASAYAFINQVVIITHLSPTLPGQS